MAWIFPRGIAYFSDGNVVASYTPPTGLAPVVSAIFTSLLWRHITEDMTLLPTRDFKRCIFHAFSTTPARVDLATVRQAIAATQHLLHLFQPQLEAKAQRKLRRLTQRLLNIDHELDRLSSKNECTLAG